MLVFFRVSFIFIFQNGELCRLQFLLESAGVRLELKGRKKEFQVGGIQTKTGRTTLQFSLELSAENECIRT